MSYKFVSASADRIEFAHGQMDNLAAVTWAAWVYPTALVNLMTIFSKGIGLHTQYALLLSGTGGDINFSIGFDTTDFNINSSNTPFATLNKWYYLAVTFDRSASPQGRMFVGDLATLAAEVTYSAQTDGSTTQHNDSGVSVVLGNRPTATFNRGWPGLIDHFMCFNAVLTPSQLWQQQFRRWPVFPSIVFHARGVQGSSTPNAQVDYSGHFQTGTLTSATIGPGVPLPGFIPLDMPALAPEISGCDDTTQTYEDTQDVSSSQNGGVTTTTTCTTRTTVDVCVIHDTGA
jgi:hypothetical protein